VLSLGSSFVHTMSALPSHALLTPGCAAQNALARSFVLP
jgi:hypothetical protein